jgi:hypothetical protein
MDLETLRVAVDGVDREMLEATLCGYCWLRLVPPGRAT